MSEPQLLTIDFLGIGIDSPQLALSLHCQQQSVRKRPSTHSCLRKIKPHMMEQVLSRSQSHRCFSNPEISQTDVSEGIKSTMDLIQQHATGFQSNSKDDYILDQQSEFSEAGIAVHLHPSPSTKSLSAQLTIFYNGAINVYGDVSAEEAEAIIKLAAGNTNTGQHTYLDSDQGAPSTTLPSISNYLSLLAGLRTSGSTNSHDLDIPPHAKLPIRNKLSLKRFLRERKNRANRLFP